MCKNAIYLFDVSAILTWSFLKLYFLKQLAVITKENLKRLYFFMLKGSHYLDIRTNCVVIFCVWGGCCNGEIFQVVEVAVCV